MNSATPPPPSHATHGTRPASRGLAPRRRRIALLFAGCFVAVAGAAGALAQAVDLVVTNGLSEPYAVAVDAQNNYFITDSANHRLARFNPDTGVLTNFVGRLGQPGYLDGAGLTAQFYSPQGIAITDRPGLGHGFAVADAGNHSIRFVTVDGQVSTLAGSPTPGFSDGPGADARFNAPAGLVADANGNIYVADSLNNAIRRLDASNVVTTIALGFIKPAGVALGDNGRLYVADTGDHSIKFIDANATKATLLAGGDSRFLGGYTDSLIATDARFQSPLGVLWVGGATGLIVSDSGNHVLRRIYFNPSLNANSVETFAASATAGLATPAGLARDLSGNILFADLGNNMLRSVETAQTPQPPVANPVIGTIILTNTTVFSGTILTAVTNATFNNDVVVGILAEPGTQTFYTITPSASPNGVPDPDSGSPVPPPYADHDLSLPPSIINPVQPDVTIKAISTQADRRPSAIVSARFRFQVANPSIIGIDPASFSLQTATLDADIWYTLNGATPTNDPTVAIPYHGERLNILSGTNDVLFSARGFKPRYQPSAVIQQQFYFTNVQSSFIGVQRDFRGGVGSTVIVPVDLRPALNQTLQSLQFRVEISPEADAPPLAAPLNALPFGANDFVPATAPGTNAVSGLFGYSTNGITTGLAVSYIGTNANFQVAGAPATVVMLAVPIPTAARIGQSYRVAIAGASATSDGRQAAVSLVPLADRHILVTNLSYLVGDTAVANGYNAGEFGNGALDNNDVNNAFYAAIGIRVPFAFSDAFDAMDAFPADSPGHVGGDGQIRFLDWQYILRRSLNLDTNRWQRSWSAAGSRVTAPSAGRGSPNLPATSTTNANPGVVWSKQAMVGALTVENVNPAATVRVPLFVNVATNANLAGLQIWPIITPIIGAPALDQPATFSTAPGIPAPAAQDALGAQVYVWNLGAFNPPLTGSNLLGYLTFSIPDLAFAGQRYTVSFANVDGAPKEELTYEFETRHADVWVQTSAPQPGDFISDEWKTNFFGSLNNPQALADADPDGDGASNWIEYLNGTNPTNPDNRDFVIPASLSASGASMLKLDLSPWPGSSGAAALACRWSSARGASYNLQFTDGLQSPNWTTIAAYAGNGYAQGVVQPITNAANRFYRVRATTP